MLEPLPPKGFYWLRMYGEWCVAYYTGEFWPDGELANLWTILQTHACFESNKNVNIFDNPNYVLGPAIKPPR